MSFWVRYRKLSILKEGAIMKFCKSLIKFFVLIVTIMSLASCDFTRDELDIIVTSEYSNLTQETRDRLSEVFEDEIASIFFQHIEKFEEMGLTIIFESQRLSAYDHNGAREEWLDNRILIDTLPDVPFGLTDVYTLEAFFNFGVFLERNSHMTFPFFQPSTHTGASEAFENEIRARDGLLELYFEVGNRIYIENFLPESMWMLNEYSNMTQRTVDFLHERFNEPRMLAATSPEMRITQTFMHFIHAFETQLGLTIKFNTVVIEDVLYEVYIDILPNVPFGLIDADAMEIFFDLRDFVINDTDIRPNMDFASFDGISEAVIDEIKGRDGLFELFMNALEQRQ